MTFNIMQMIVSQHKRRAGTNTSSRERILRAVFLILGVFTLLYLPIARHAHAGGTGLNAGRPCPPYGAFPCANPITLPTGNSHQKATDFTTAGPNPLAVTRHSNSLIGNPGGSFGNWRWTYDRSLFITSSEVGVQREDGKEIRFGPDGLGGWKGVTNLDLKLKKQGAVWTLTDWQDNVEIYEEISHGGTALEGRLTSIKARNGYTQTLHYNGPFDPLSSVTDSFGRTLTIAYGSNGRVSSITCPDG
ncbi:MAG: DUF6531 domain-containing protein [Beijerinckiaceae bacterium]|nr:DUF6531 domain-containing protein [Beijerinckiaceae bacterium]